MIYNFTQNDCILNLIKYKNDYSVTKNVWLYATICEEIA